MIGGSVLSIKKGRALFQEYETEINILKDVTDSVKSFSFKSSYFLFVNQMSFWADVSCLVLAHM
jgi:hypothetical protein